MISDDETVARGPNEDDPPADVPYLSRMERRMVWKNVQGLRGIAALLVVFAHTHDFTDVAAYNGLLKMWAPIGACGVDLFFVISGFIMASVHWNDFGAPDSSRRFLLRRIVRIFPPYWVVTLILAGTFAVAPWMKHHWMGGSANVWLSLLLIPQPSGSTPLLFVGWTLLYEMYFYYAFAAALRLERKAAFVAFGIWAVGIVAIQFVPAAFATPYSAFFARNLIVEFLLGVGIGALAMQGRFVKPATFLVLGIVALVATEATKVLYLHGNEQSIDSVRFLIEGVPMTAILYGAIGLEKMRGTIIARPLQRAGDASYSVYLWHGPLYVVVGKIVLALDHHVHIPKPLLIATVPVLVTYASFELYRFVEIPLTSQARRLATRVFPDLMAGRKPILVDVPERTLRTA